MESRAPGSAYASVPMRSSPTRSRPEPGRSPSRRICAGPRIRTSAPIVILLERKHDAWLARWSGANAWFVRPVDPFELADRLVELIGNDRDQPKNQPKDQRETV